MYLSAESLVACLLLSVRLPFPLLTHVFMMHRLGIIGNSCPHGFYCHQTKLNIRHETFRAIKWNTALFKNEKESKCMKLKHRSDCHMYFGLLLYFQVLEGFLYLDIKGLQLTSEKDCTFFPKTYQAVSVTSYL